MVQLFYFPVSHASLSSALSSFVSWQSLGIKTMSLGDHQVGRGRPSLHNSQSRITPTIMLPMQLGRRGWAPLKLGLGSEWWTERTIIDYYIKQNEIVSPLEGRKVINSEGPVIGENDITSAVCFGLKFKRKNWKESGVGWEVEDWQLRELDCAAALPASTSLHVSLPVGLTHLLWHPFLPLQRRLRRKETEVNAIPFYVWKLGGSQFSDACPQSIGLAKKFVWAFVWKNLNEHFGQTNNLALSLQGNSRAACLPLVFGRLPCKDSLARTQVGLSQGTRADKAQQK